MQFQLQLHIAEAEMNNQVIRKELNNRNNKVLPLIIIEITAEILVNGTATSAIDKISNQLQGLSVH